MFIRIILLLSIFSSLSMAGPRYYKGGVDRGDINTKALSFVFTGGFHGEGVDHILDVLKEKKVRGSFFLTGNYFRNPKFKAGVERMIREGHYVGVHSDNHPKYVKKHGDPNTLISQWTFNNDLDKNFAALAAYGVKKSDALYWIPPYEMYNQTISNWSNAYGLKLFNYTPGTRTNGDYTDPSSSYYYSSKKILEYVWKEEAKPNGLNGHIMLVHVGVGPKRTDKFYYQLGPLIDQLRAKGYEIKSVPALIEQK